MGERIATFHSTLLGYLFGGGEGDGGLVNHLARGIGLGVGLGLVLVLGVGVGLGFVWST